MSGYVVTPEADNDFVEIWYYTRQNWGVEQANSYLNQLERCFQRLVRHPDLGKARDEIRKGYRSCHEGRHLIFYRQNEDQIEIVRVLHQSMDIQRHF